MNRKLSLSSETVDNQQRKSKNAATCSGMMQLLPSTVLVENIEYLFPLTVPVEKIKYLRAGTHMTQTCRFLRVQEVTMKEVVLRLECEYMRSKNLLKIDAFRIVDRARKPDRIGGRRCPSSQRAGAEWS